MSALTTISVLFLASISGMAGTPIDLGARAANQVACEGIAYGVGNITISSTTNASFTYQVLEPGPSHDFAGHSFLQLAHDLDFPVVAFMWCNSSYMDYTSYNFIEDNTLVEFYGHLVQFGSVGEPFEKNCATRTLDGDITWEACTHVDGPDQVPQYWKMVKSEQNPALPASLNFIGHPNGTDNPFEFNPTLRAFNGTRIVSEQLVWGDSSAAEYQLSFNMRGQ